MAPSFVVSLSLSLSVSLSLSLSLSPLPFSLSLSHTHKHIHERVYSPNVSSSQEMARASPRGSIMLWPRQVWSVAISQCTLKLFIHIPAFTVLYYEKDKQQHQRHRQHHSSCQDSIAGDDITEIEELFSFGFAGEGTSITADIPPAAMDPATTVASTWL